MDRQPDTRRMAYRRPEIVNVGEVAVLTGALGTPTRDNPNSLGDPAYHNAAINHIEVDLDD